MGTALVYGRGPKSLGEQLGVSTQEAKGYIQKYFSIYASIGAWLNNAADTAVRTRQCRTIGGRIRHFEFNWHDSAERSSAEREGKNTPIQGSNASMTKLALYLIHVALDELGYTDLGARIVNCIHDEICVESPTDIAEEVGALVKYKMEEAGAYFVHKVPITAEMVIADTWAAKK
ncbi:hypothetical protein A2Y26_00885 [candidate division CPR2 bacterium GWD2_39_7]|nr:MAG: polymerase protein [candidate division CPR2 bacterium GW2011_GWD2_39_7]OGB71781.1 MAG: hypothetical protein A2Y26_00885 [candidate division CPR2 bacterium GWD2_39_7]